MKVSPCGENPPQKTFHPFVAGMRGKRNNQYTTAAINELTAASKNNT
jgi:hypothetical protein